MMVLTDEYITPLDPSGFKSVLYAGKEMGFSAAYCDNDNSAINPQRDHFVGSKYLREANSDRSWQDASILGYMKLVNEQTTSLKSFSYNKRQMEVYPNPVCEFAYISFTNSYLGKVELAVFNSAGQRILNIQLNKYQERFEQKIDFSSMKAGVYFVQLVTAYDRMFVKIIK